MRDGSRGRAKPASLPKDLAARLAEHKHGRVPRALRKEQLLVEATRLFSEKGYAAASMDELATRVGVSKPVIYEIGGSKEDLFREVVSAAQVELAEGVAAAVAAAPSLQAQLRAGLLAFLRFVERHRAGWRTLLSMDGGEGAAVIRALQDTQVSLVATLLAAGAVGKPPAVGHLAFEVLARAINGAAETVALWWDQHPELTPEELADLLSELLRPGFLSIMRGR